MVVITMWWVYLFIDYTKNSKGSDHNKISIFVSPLILTYIYEKFEI